MFRYLNHHFYFAKLITPIFATSQDNNAGVISENGWAKLPNGLILQWGKLPRRSGIEIVSFPIQFPHKLFYVSTQSSATWDSAVVNCIYNRSNNGFTAVVDRTSGGGDIDGTGWFAIGY